MDISNVADIATNASATNAQIKSTYNLFTIKEKTDETNSKAYALALKLLEKHLETGRDSFKLSEINLFNLTEKINPKRPTQSIPWIKEKTKTSDDITYFLLKDSENENIVGIIVRLPGWQLYPFQIVTTQ